MGRTVTPTHRLEMSGTTGMAWEGRATQKRLEEWIRSYAKSLEIGGVNQHVSEHFGYIPYPVWARIVRQSTNGIMAEWKAAAFQVW